MSLTAAEKLQAISSPWANYITHLERTHLIIDGGLVDLISFDDTRGRAFQNTAQLVYCCAGLPGAKRIPTAHKLEKWLISPDERPTTAFQDAMTEVLNRLWEIARKEGLDAPFRRFRAKVSPVEFVYLGAPRYHLSSLSAPLSGNVSYFILFCHLQACCCTHYAVATPSPSNPAPCSSSDATSARLTLTCASTRASLPTAGAS
jgi:hypothetical protein